MMRMVDISVESNCRLYCRERGKLAHYREGHNVFTLTGRNWLSKLVAWRTIGGSDGPYTGKRVRWIGVGSGSQLEVTTVASLQVPALYAVGYYMAELDSVEFPTSTSVRFKREFAAGEISIAGSVDVSEAALYADINPASAGGYDDEEFGVGEGYVLDPAVGTNPPISYFSFEPFPKTTSFTFVVEWEYRF